KVGSTLTARTTWTEKPSKVTYQWYASGKAIKGATKSKLKVTTKQVGKKISVVVSGTRDGYTKATSKSARTVAVPKIASKIKVSVSKGTKKYGSTVLVKVRVSATNAPRVRGLLT